MKGATTMATPTRNFARYSRTRALLVPTVPLNNPTDNLTYIILSPPHGPNQWYAPIIRGGQRPLSSVCYIDQATSEPSRPFRGVLSKTMHVSLR